MGFNPFKAIFGGILSVLSFAAFAALGPLGAAFWGTVFSWGSALVFGSTVLLSAFAALRQQNYSLPDITRSVYATNTEAKTVYGTMALGGVICDLIEDTDPDVYIARYAVCEKKAGFQYEIQDVELAGEWLNLITEDYKLPADGATRAFGQNGKGATSASAIKIARPGSTTEWAGKLEIFFVDGPATEADLKDFGWVAADASATWQGEGLVWASIKWARNDTARETFRDHGARFEFVRFRVRALPVDGVFSTDTANPADVLYLHLVNEIGIPADRIDRQPVARRGAAVDRAFSFDDTAAEAEARFYRCDGFYRSGQEYDALGWILQSMGAALVEDGGKYYLRGLTTPAPRLTITEDMLTETPEIEHTVPWRSRYNTIRGELIDREAGYTRQSTPEFRHAAGYAEDGNRTYLLDVGAMAFVNTVGQAEKLLVEELAKRRVQEKITLQIHASDVPGIRAYDMITLNLVRNGIAANFRVASVVHAIEGTVALTCISEAGVETARDGLSAVPVLRALRAYTTGLSVAHVVWEFVRNPQITGWEYRYKTSSATEWGAWTRDGSTNWRTASVGISGLAPRTTYDFQVRALIGAVSGAASNTVSATTGGSLPAVTGLAAAATVGGVSVTWNAVSGVQKYAVRFRRSGSSAYHYSTVETTRYVRSDLVEGYTYDVGVRSGGLLDASYGPWTADISFTTLVSTPRPTAPAAPANLRGSVVDDILEFGLSRVSLFWNPVSGATSYEWASSLTASGTPGGWTTISGGAGARSVAFDQATGFGDRWFHVRAKNAHGTGPYSTVRLTG